MDDILIREAADDDGPGLSALMTRVFGEYDGCLFEPAEYPEHDRPASHFAERGGRLWVVTRDGEIIGSLAIARHHAPDEFVLTKLYLDASARGEGFATALLAGAEAFVAASGGTRLSLWSDTRFEDGHRFYERHGFVRSPGVRSLHDVSNTLEHHFAKDVPPLAGEEPDQVS